MASILLIDDENSIRRMFRTLLQSRGYTILEAADGNVAMQVLRERSVDLVITDIFMPSKDGLEVIKELRRGHPSTKIIALSGGNRRVGLEALSVAKLMGAAYVFDKPVDIFQSLEAIDTLLGKTIQAPDDFGRTAP